MYLTAQIIGLIAFIFSLVAYHKKDKTTILNNLIIANILNVIHYVMLGALSGCATKALAVTRDSFIIEKSKFKKLSNVGFLYLFVFVYLTFMYITYRGVITILPFVASIFYLIGIWEADEFTTKKVAFYSFIPWLIYNICVLSISGIISNIIQMISTYIAIKSTKKLNL